MNIEQMYSRNGYLTRGDVTEPLTLVIDRFEYEDESGEMELYFTDGSRIALTDAYFESVWAITGSRDARDWPGYSVRLYPVDFPKRNVEIF